MRRSGLQTALQLLSLLSAAALTGAASVPDWQVRSEHVSRASEQPALLELASGLRFAAASTAARASWRDVLVAFSAPEAAMEAWVLLSACYDAGAGIASSSRFSQAPSCPAGAAVHAVHLQLSPARVEEGGVGCADCRVASVWRSARSAGADASWERVLQASGVVLVSGEVDDGGAVADVAAAVLARESESSASLNSSASNAFAAVLRLDMGALWDVQASWAAPVRGLAVAAWVAEAGNGAQGVAERAERRLRAERLAAPPGEWWSPRGPLPRAAVTPERGWAVCPADEWAQFASGFAFAPLAVAAGKLHSCALLGTRGVRCWGYGIDGQLGYGSGNHVGDNEPVGAAEVALVDRSVAVVGLGLGASHSCAVLASGRVRCWGNGWSGQLGYANTQSIGDDEAPSSAGDVDVGGDAVQVAAGQERTCALLSTKRVRCWGSQLYGPLGYVNFDTIGDDETPASAGDVDVGGDVVQIAVGQDHACALLSTRRVRCWGSGDDGRLGYGNTFAIGDDETPASAGDVDVGADVVQVAAGGRHTCALVLVQNSRRVRCWGSGRDGRLGYGNALSVGDDETPSSAGDVDVGGGDVLTVTTGEAHTCALLATLRVRCWGLGLNGRLGYGNTRSLGDDETPSSAGDVDVGADVVQVAAGGSFTCAVLATRRVLCWGEGGFGYLGLGTFATVGDDEVPSSVRSGFPVDDFAFFAPLATLPTVLHHVQRPAAVPTALAVGFSHACARLSTGRLLCWGLGQGGRLGYGNALSIGDDESPSSAGDVRVGAQVVQVATGLEHTCALLASGRVRCWGRGQYGQLGYGNTDDVGDDEHPDDVVDVDVAGGAGVDVISIAAGIYHTCVLLSTRRVRCWGRGEHGRLGYGNTLSIGDDETPSSAGDVDVGGGDVVQVAAGNMHTCALLASGRVRCWGRGQYGQLGYGNTFSIGDDETPSSAGDVPLGTEAVVAVATSTDHTCALLASRRVRCWGLGTSGQLGVGSGATIGDDEPPSAAPLVDVGGAAVVALALGYDHSCALLASGRVRCWGGGSVGQLGYGNTGSVAQPGGDVAVGGDVIAIAAGGAQTCALLASRRVRCWGDGLSGQLGYGSTESIGDNETPASLGDVFVALSTDAPVVQALAEAVGANVTALLVPASHLHAGATAATTISMPSVRAPLPASLQHAPGVDVLVSPEQSTPAVCLSESGVRLVGGRYACVADDPAAGLAASRAALAVSVASSQSQSLGALATAGSSSVVVSGDFSALALFGNPSVRVGDKVAADARFRRGASELHFLAPAGIGANLSLTLTPTLAPSAPAQQYPASLRAALASQLPAVSYRAPSIGSVAPAAGLAVLGGSSVVLSGASFGPSAVHGVGVGEAVASSLQIRVAGRPCLESRSIADTLVECVTPRLVGAGLRVSVSVGGQEAEAAQTVDTARPVVTGVQPAYLLAGGAAPQDILLTGTHLALVSEDVDLNGTSVGGLPCQQVRVEAEGERLRCLGLDASAGWALGSTPSSLDASAVQVSVAGQSSGSVAGLFFGEPPVAVVAVSPLGPASTAGGAQVRVIADGLGRRASDVVAVHLQDSAGRSAVLSSFAWSQSQVQFSLPAGVGDVRVRLESAVGHLSDPATVSFDPPVVSAVSPAHLLLGASGVNVTLAGRNLPPAVLAPSLPPHLANVSLGGVACASVRVVSSTELVCAAFATGGVQAWTDPEAVEVCVGGRCSGRVLGVFTAVQRPVVSDTSPQALPLDGDLTLLGANFGLSGADLGPVFVGGVPCAVVTWLSPSSATCATPATHPTFKALFDAESAAVDADVVLCNAENVCSAPLRVPLAGRGDAARPAATPLVTDAVRQVGQFDVLAVAWSFPDAADELALVEAAVRGGSRDVDVASHFVVQVAPGASFASAVAQSVVPRSAASAEVTVSRHAPYFVRVAAQTVAGGVGNFSAAVGPCYEACTETQYLRVQARDLADRVCEPCPEAFAVCGGLPAWNVTARSGFWRLAWAGADPLAPLRFAACVLPDACEGWAQPPPRASNSSRGRVAIPNLRLVPDLIERCAPGHDGVLCDACRAGFFKGLDGRCAPCGSRGVAALRVLGVLLAVMLLLAIFLVRTVTTATSTPTSTSTLAPGKIVVATLKILLNHLQTIAIVAAAPVRWPAAVAAFFASASAGSNLSTQGIGLECVMDGPAAKNPFVMQSLTIYVLVPASLLYALLFWLLYDPASQLCAPCSSSSSHSSSSRSLLSSRAGSPPRALGRRMWMSLGVLSVAMAATVSSAALRLVSCRTVAPEPVSDADAAAARALAQSRMVANLDFRCDDPATWSLALALALPPLLLYSLGLPLYMAFVLSSQGQTSRPPKAPKEGAGESLGAVMWDVWSFAVAGYRTPVRWWESWVMLRKLALVAVAVLLATHAPSTQLASAMAVVLVAGFAHSWVKPFAVDILNVVEMAAHVVTSVTVLAGLYLASAASTADTDGTADGTSVAVTAVTLLANILFILLVLVTIVMTIRDAVVRRQAASSSTSRSTRPSAADGLVPSTSNPLHRRSRSGRTTAPLHIAEA